MHKHCLTSCFFRASLYFAWNFRLRRVTAKGMSGITVDTIVRDATSFVSENDAKLDPSLVINVNMSNVRTLSPFEFAFPESDPQAGHVAMDREFYEAFLTDTQQALLQQVVKRATGKEIQLRAPWEYPNDHLRHVERGGGLHKGNTYFALFQDLYQVYLDTFGYSQFCEHLTFEDVGIEVTDGGSDRIKDCVIEVPPGDWKAIVELALVRVLLGKPLPGDAAEELSSTLTNAIQGRLDRFVASHGGCFVKLGSKSAKNDVRLQPLRTINDVLNTITDSKDVLGWAEKDTGERYMVLLPWNSTITADNEYRVFQRNGLPTAISQQKWYRDLGFEITDAELAACVTELCQRLSRHPGWYAACCLDVYVRRGAQGAWRAYVIEANPWGEAFSSGSSLFDWIAHQKALRDSTCVTIAKRQRR